MVAQAGRDDVVDRAPVAAYASLPARWARATRSDLGFCLVVYLGTRLAVALGALISLAAHPGRALDTLAYRWDGWWYLGIAAHGYTSTLRPNVAGWHHRYSDWAFYPAYPLLVRGLHAVAPGTAFSVVGLGVSFLTGFAAVLAVHQLGTQYSGRATGRSAALLLAAWPGSAAFSLPYSEGLFVAATALALTCLLRHRWVLAGAAGFVSTTSRASGVALLLAATVVAVVEARRSHRLAPLAAPLLTAAGTVSFLAYGYLRTGDALVWRHAENLWQQRLDLGAGMLRDWAHNLPMGRGDEVLELLAAVGLLWLVAVALPAVRDLSDPLVVYTAGALALLLAYSAVGPRPRMVLGAFPLFVLAAPHIPRRTRAVLAPAWTVILGVVTFMWLRTVTP
jgi:hypothetical protein